MSDIGEHATKFTFGEYSTERMGDDTWVETERDEPVGVSDRMRCPTIRAGDTFTIETRMTIT